MLSTAVSIAGKVLSTCSQAQARFERRVLLGIESLGLRHAAGHPQQDHGVGLRLDLGRTPQLPRRSAHQRRHGGAADACMKCRLFIAWSYRTY